ncbi:hypothetical protein QMZ07_03900 [Enterococcus faecalis]
MIPVIFKPGEKDFAVTGLEFSPNATRCEITEEANGKYELEMEHPAISRCGDCTAGSRQITAKLFCLGKCYK